MWKSQQKSCEGGDRDDDQILADCMDPFPWGHRVHRTDDLTVARRIGVGSNDRKLGETSYTIGGWRFGTGVLSETLEIGVPMWDSILRAR